MINNKWLCYVFGGLFASNDQKHVFVLVFFVFWGRRMISNNLFR